MKLVALILGLTLFSWHAQAASCKSVATCVELVSKLTGKNYIYSEPLKGEVSVNAKFKIDKTNADEFISLILNQNGYTRVSALNGNYQIINARDVRYTPLEVYEIDKDKLPNTHDYIMGRYQLKYPFRAREITRSFRPFMSRYGRIIDMQSSGTIIIQDTATNVTRLVQLLKTLDVKPSDKELDAYEKAQEERRELKVLEAKNCKSVIEKLVKKP